VTLLERVAACLSERGVAHALIGAAALAVHGVSRSTLDQDLLVVDGRVLERGFWAPLAADAGIDVRRGDAADPLAGVVRISRAGDRDVDVVVGRHRWQEEIITRAEKTPGTPARVAQAPDLILLKLYAGGSQDRWDIEQLLALDSSGTIRSIVDDGAVALPARSRELWSTLRSATSG
jgi:hypothetical protein